MSDERDGIEMLQYHLTALASMPASEVFEGTFEVEYEGGHSGDVEISRLAKKASDTIGRLQRELLAQRASNEELQVAAEKAIQHMPGGNVKAELRDAVDNMPVCSLRRRDNLIKAALLEKVASDIMQMDERASNRGISTAILMSSRDYTKLAEEDQ